MEKLRDCNKNDSNPPLKAGLYWVSLVLVWHHFYATFQEKLKYADQCIGHFFTCKYVIAENNLLHLKPKLQEKDNIL